MVEVLNFLLLFDSDGEYFFRHFAALLFIPVEEGEKIIEMYVKKERTSKQRKKR